MKGSHEACKSLDEFLRLNYGEMDCMVGVGTDRLLVYVTRGKKHMNVVPKKWEGFTVWTKWTGKVKPL